MEEPKTPRSAPDLLIWGQPDAVTSEWLASLQAATGPGHEILLAGDHLPPIPGARSLETRDDTALSAVQAAIARSQARPWVLIAAGVELPMDCVVRLQRAAECSSEAAAVSALCNENPQLAPIPAGCKHRADDVGQVDALLFLHSRRRVFEHHAISQTFSLWLPERLPAGMSEAADWAALEQAVDSHATAAICDHLYVQIPDRAIHGPRERRPGDPMPPASPLDEFRETLFKALDGPNCDLPLPGLDQRPVQLHILHSWGGGVAKWVAEISQVQNDRHHLMLTAWGIPGDYQCGQELRLYAGSLEGEPVRRWTLPRAIQSSDMNNAGYRRVLNELVADFGVDQVVVSSLVGHSLDALRLPLPTLLVFHDFYPAWPVLQVHVEAQSEFSTEALARAIDEHARDHRFRDKNPADWEALRDIYLEDLNRDQRVFAAPSRSVVENLQRIDARFKQLDITVVPHGFDGFSDASWRYRAPEAPLDRRLRVVIPGRIASGKGKRLLGAAIDSLRQWADIYLVGAGKDGEEFFGTAGIHLIPDYQIDEFPSLMEAIEPDLGLLLSTVSETYSYTLSELQALGIPVMATRVGALAERIQPGATGWLIDPTVDSLVAAVKDLAENPQQLAEMAGKMNSIQSSSRLDMAAHYGRIFPALKVPAARYRLTDPSPASLSGAIVSQRSMSLELRLARVEEKVSAQQVELNRRADWAFRLNRQLDSRTRWAEDLEHDLKETRVALEGLRNEFEDRTAWALDLVDEVATRDDHIRAQLEQIRELSIIAERHEQVINSRSWRLTKPLRYVARSLRSVRERLGFQSRRAASLARRTQNSLRVRGVGGTVDRIRDEMRTPDVSSTPITIPEIGEATDQIIFASEPEPTVSIIIPVYNQYAHTHACLKSILAAANHVSFEVVVVDDSSSDETEARLATHQGLTILRNEENLGFIGSCNRGAQAARGEYLLFLNNDTAVADGWLDALMSTFGRHPDAGLVGAKLVYPDGRLQEAGGIVFSDGSGWNYGRFENPDHPAYNFVREVDYCSGACIVLPADLFKRLGCFDSRYAPAYYEDTDLAFKVREAGLKVYYQPHSVVTHFEGISSGTDLTSGAKQYQVVNQKKFLERWQSVLENHPRPGSPIEVARQHRRRRHALIIDATTPTPDQDSGSVRMLNLMSLLGELGFRVTFLADNRAWVKGYSEALQQRGVEVYYQPFVESPADLLSELGQHLDTVILSRHYIARNYIDWVRRYCPDAQLLFDTVDLHYLREQRLAALEEDDKLVRQAEVTRHDELEVARRCDTTVVVSPVEVEVLAADAPDLDVRVLSNIHPVVGCRKPFGERSDIFFVGGFQHPPNIDAVLWFTHEIFPLVRKELPDLKFHIVGSKAPPEVRRLSGDGVEYQGFVHDLDPYLDGCRLAVAPLRYGAGVKGKVNMSMSYGQPVIATSTGIEGMYAEVGKDVLVGDDPASFADAVISAYGDEALWNQLSANGLANVEQHFSFNAARRALIGMLDSLPGDIEA